jgi:phosphate starvation-inducible PhoH-like protein
MAKKNGRQGKNKKKRFDIDYLSDDKVVIDLKRSEAYSSNSCAPPSKPRPFKAKNIAQGQFVSAIKANILTFGLGPAGTGKTYCAAAMAAEGVDEGTVKQIIFTRPAVETGPSLGFLPGKLDEKFDHYFSAFKHCLTKLLGKGFVDCAIKNRNLVAEPLTYMRGKTFDNAFVILDEAQNCTEAELKMFMTRIGESSTVVINGDLEQSDIGEDSGLYSTVQRVSHINKVHVHEFDYQDIVRSGIVRDILFSYNGSRVRG